MKILQLHNEYVYPGGEDAVVASESALLRSYGHEIVEYRRSNKELPLFGPFARAGFYLRNIFFSSSVYREVVALIRRERPSLAHFHNTFFMIGSAAYEACFDEGVPVIQTLHNYRFLCPAAIFFRSGQICEECLSRGKGRAVRHGCWQGSRLKTWLLVRVIREYERRSILKRISRFIALSEFSRRKFIAAGWPGEKIVVKPNFLEARDERRETRDEGEETRGERLEARDGKAGRFVLYAGALQPWKGIRTLLKAWASREWPVPLKIVGSGPLEKELKAQQVSGVQWLGQRTSDEVMALMKDAVCVVVPSECYENFPRVIIEAYACGVPVVATRLGALEELVQDGQTGCLFRPGDLKGLRDAMRRVVEDPVFAEAAGSRAREIFEARYTDTVQQELLERSYHSVIDLK